jgi:hypothetical protein
MKAFFQGLGVIGFILLIIAILLIGPMLFLWSINSLSELGGSSFYIDHSVWSYVVSLVFLAVMKASADSK